jgi:hypothetical protein
MRTLYLLCLLGIALILPVLLYAGDHEGWTVTNFNNENGLPQNSVNFAQMDNDGYLWLATQAGIVRYDGQRFRLFDKSNSALQMNRYVMFGKDSNGHIYYVDDALKTAFYNKGTGFSKPVAALPNMAVTADGGLIDLNRLDIAKMTSVINKITHGVQPDGITFVFHATGKGRGFIVWNYSIAGYISDGKVQRIDTIDVHRATEYVIGCVGDKLCYISKNKDFVLVDSNGVRTRQKIPFAVPWDKLNSYFNVLTFFRQEDQMLFNADGNIYEVKLADNKLQFHHIIEVKDIPGIYCIRYYPKKNLLVIGSNTKGLYLFKRKQFISVGNNYWQNANSFSALAPYGSNQVIATTGKLPNGPSVPGMIESLNRFSILRDRNGYYWYSNRFTLLKADDQFRILKKVPLLPQALICIREDEQGTIWLSQGIVKFGWVQGDTFQRYKLDSLEGKGLRTINSFIPAGNQTFWLVGYHLCIWLDVKHHRQRIYHEFDNIELPLAGQLWAGILSFPERTVH